MNATASLAAGPVCLKCRAPLPAERYNAPALFSCPSCGTPSQVFVFPSLFRPLTAGAPGEQVQAETESSCFYHPQKRAVVPCDSCGRFLCSLCDLELNQRHLCPSCFESGKKKGKVANLERERVLYDRIALLLAAVPLLMWPATVLTAPVTLFIVIRYWRAPLSLVSRTRIRFIIAGLLALLQIAGWVAFVVFLVSRIGTDGP